LSTFSQNFATRLLPEFGAASAPPPAGFRPIPGARESLLNVGQVAQRLGVSTATVYRLCERGELAHLRVSNAIRVTPGDLEEFVTRRRRVGEPLR
jgi:excisionase family DNA binding protein